MDRTAHRTLTLAVAATLAGVWIVAQPVAAGGAAADSPAHTAARDDSRLAQTWQAEAARTRAAAPGRAALLRSPFGPAPAHAADDTAAPPPALTHAQALQLDEQLDGEVAWVQLGCCGTDDADQARGVVHGVMAAKNLPADAPVFIEATTPALAAQLAVRLVRDGLPQVFVVIP